jgi:cytochrome c-type biogenesis protein CcmH
VKRMVAAAILVLMCLPVTAADLNPPLSSPAKQQLYDDLTHQLRCLQCQSETVAETPAKFAVDIRRQVREMVEAGSSEADVRHYMVQRYGELILLKPLFNMANAWLWLAPGAFVLGGICIAWRILRQRRDMLASDTTEVADEVDRQ